MQPDLDDIIEQLITSQAIASQDELGELLAQRGLSVTQSTLSRRLRRLGIDKRDGRYQRAPESLPAQALSALPVPPNLLVLRTRPGFANALGFELDRVPLPGQAGTLAGDDTVFVALHARSMQPALHSLRQRGLLADSDTLAAPPS